MKMAYERPVMKAELFAANDYVAACTKMPQLSGFIEVIHKTIKLLFKGILNGEGMIYSYNQYSGDDQFYYVGYDKETGEKTDYYLEYSAHQNGAWVLYEESGASTGYYKYDGSGNKYSSSNYDQIFDGSSTLQTNTGAEPTFAKDSGWNYRETKYYDSNGDTQTADAWVADKCLGTVTPSDGTFTIVNS